MRGRVVTEENNAINAGGEYRYLFGAGAAVGDEKQDRVPIGGESPDTIRFGGTSSGCEMR